MSPRHLRTDLPPKPSPLVISTSGLSVLPGTGADATLAETAGSEAVQEQAGAPDVAAPTHPVQPRVVPPRVHVRRPEPAPPQARAGSTVLPQHRTGRAPVKDVLSLVRDVRTRRAAS